jgi:hypothetical protein
MSADVQYVTRPYLYANGVRYRENLKLIKILTPQGPSVRNVGGMIITKRGKFFAFASESSAAILVQEDIDSIKKRADFYAWGNTAREALMQVRPHLTKTVGF